MTDWYGEDTVYLSNTGVRLYSYFEYLLDIIATNLNCYKKDIFRNEGQFGVSAINLQDADDVKQVIESVIKARVPDSITVSDCSVGDGVVTVTLSGSFGIEQVSIELDDEDKKSFKIQKIRS